MEGAVGAQVVGDGMNDVFLVQPVQKAIAAGDLETDGTFCWIRVEGDALLGAVREGTYVRYRGDPLHASDSPATRTFEAQ